MNRSTFKTRPIPAAELLIFATLALSGCGGGGSENTPAADVPTAAQQTDSVQPDGGDTQAVAPVPIRYDLLPPSAEVGVSADDTTVAEAATATTSSGKVYYVDRRIGADTNNGASAANAGTGVGPWKTLARVASATLAAGDTVYLACGSVWDETLKISRNGLSGQPIRVSSYPAGCSNRPVIDGSDSIDASAWKLHAGNVYSVPLASAPHSVFSPAGRFVLAHHPNRNHDPSQPTSVYLRNAVDSDSPTIGGRPVSTYVTTGADLNLPAGASIAPGTPIRIRNNAWLLNETTVSAVNGSRLSLAQPTGYPVKAGWGFVLLGRPWMVDSPGEWAYDASAKLLYAWMPDSLSPKALVDVGLRETGIDLQGRAYITVEGVSVLRVRTGVNMRGTTGVTIRGSNIQDVEGKGIDAAASVAASIESNVITRTGTDGISLTDDASVAGNRASIKNNDLSNTGVVVSSDGTIVSLPHTVSAGIRSGTNSVVSGNVVRDTGRMGIWPMAGSTVDRNYVTGACSVLDDCGGIYTSGQANNGTISNNIVTSPRGAIEGKPASIAYTQAQGIFLDESAAGVSVTGNTVTDADNGIQIHVAANNTIRGNKFYGNRKSQIWLQETRNVVKPTGDVFGNVIEGNSIVATSPSANNVLQETMITSTLAFASYDQNRYFDRLYTRVAKERTPSAEQDYTFQQWQAATSPGGTPRNLDQTGYSAAQQTYAAYTIAGANIVPNNTFAATLTGWTSWNQTAPYGTLARVGCFAGYCAQYTAVATPSLLSSPNFTIRQGQWYRLSVDMLASSDALPVQLIVRRSGGGSNGYESLSNVSMNTRPGQSWSRITFLFQGTKTVYANDPVTLDKGARLDFQVGAGQTITVANVEIVPTTAADATTRTDLLLNTGTTELSAACPVAASSASTCSTYYRFTDDAPISWPYTLPARSSEIVYTRDTRLIDGDGDGIPDSQDSCQSSGAGLAVDSRGCAINQTPA